MRSMPMGISTYLAISDYYCGLCGLFPCEICNDGTNGTCTGDIWGKCVANGG